MYEVITAQRQADSALSVVGMCEALNLTRADYYRWQAGPVVETAPDIALLDQIQHVALAWPSCGYRQITHELRRQEIVANHKRVLRLMREDNLLCLRKKAFVKTMGSDHVHPIYPNLAREKEVTGINQLWVADITYIHLQREFIYLAVILDAYSRRCIGWALGRSLEVGLAVAALQMALSERAVGPRLVHHSDRGVQYASREYTSLLNQHGIRISMSRRGNPYDNAKAESFMKSLKNEEVYLYEYESLTEVIERISQFLEEVYNQKRLHSAIGYVPPAEFEQPLSNSTIATLRLLSIVIDL